MCGFLQIKKQNLREPLQALWLKDQYLQENEDFVVKAFQRIESLGLEATLTAIEKMVNICMGYLGVHPDSWSRASLNRNVLECGLFMD